MAAALRAAGVVPAVQTVAAGTPSLDVSLLADRGNRLLTAAVQFANCRPIVPATGVKVSVPDIVPAAAFAFPATAVAGDVVRSGPVKVFWEKNDSGCTVELGTVKSALPVLLVQNDCQPLLALAVPAKVKSGADTVLTVTCHNPAAADISGTLTLTAPGVKTSAPVQIPAWGSAEVKLTFAAPAAAPRLPLQVKLTAEKTAVDAIPVNITVE